MVLIYYAGIVSPYRAQCTSIKNSLELNGIHTERLMINTAESFQGQERPIIIISTVRAKTSSQSLGFVSDKRVRPHKISRKSSCIKIKTKTI